MEGALVPVAKDFIDANTALVTFLGVLVGIFIGWYSLQSEKKESKKEVIEKEINEMKEHEKDHTREEIMEFKKEKEIETTDSEIIEKEKIRTKVSDASISGLCLGRDTELVTLEKNLTQKNVIIIKGIVGIGKTTLGLKFRNILEEKGYHTLWYQCDSESYEGFLIYLSDYLKNRGSRTFMSLKDQRISGQERLKTAVQELCIYPTVLFLDNFQVVDDSDFRIFKDHLKNSTLVVMSRMQPAFVMESYESLSSLDSDSSINLLRELEVKESLGILEKIYEKTQGHPWSLVQFADLARVLPAKELLDELPNFGKEQENYMNEECWKHLNEHEKDFLMRASVFRKPLTFDALEVCCREGTPSDVVLSLAQRFYLIKREEYYYIHDIMRDFSFSKLKEDSKLYIEAQRIAADYYGRKVSAENLLLMYYHLKEAGNHKEGLDSIIENISYFWKEGYWSDVREVLEESLNFFKDEKTRAGIYYCIGSIMDDLGQWDTAIEYYEKSLEIKENLGDISGIGRTYNNLGLVYAAKGQWDTAIEYYEKSLEISENLGDISGIGRTYNNLGSVYAAKGQWDTAIEYYEKSLEISENLGDISGIGQTYNNLGLVYAAKGQWDTAIEYYEKDLEISENLGDISGIGRTYNNLGLVYAAKGQWDTAIEYYEKSLEISENLGDISGIGRTYNNLGSVYAAKGQWDTAIEYYEKDLEISENLGDISGMAITWENLAEAYCGKNDTDTALDYCNNSFETLEKLGDRPNLAEAHKIYGTIFRKRKEFSKSKEELEKSIKIYMELSAIYELAKAYFELAMTLLEINDKRNAKEYFSKALEIFKKLKVNHRIVEVEEQLKSI
ncbi:MAG: tetratricopeptide repeat protein [Theionarchaea archaeon]|nr:tetratricopeptide repeat protein [Theionarchaea archaeon]